MFTEPAALLPLVPKQLRDGEPPDWLLERLHSGGDHPRQRWGHFGPERDVPVPLVPKRVQLLDDLVPALLGVQLERFQRRTVVFLKAVARSHAAPGRKDVVSEAQVFRVEIAKAG